jgi:O-antigen ligase
MKSTPSVPSRSYPSGSPQGPIGEDSPEASSFWTIAFFFALASIFILYSRFFDVAANGLYIPRIVLSLMVLFFLTSGRALVFLQSTTGKFVVALIAWASFTLFTSIWKSGSLGEYYLLVQSALIFVVAAGLPLLVRDVKRMMTTLALAGLAAALLSIPFGSTRQARLSLRSGSYFDPNTYAMALIAVIPFFWALAAASRSFFVKIFSWLSMLAILVTVARSGSRGAMLGFGVMIVILFLISSVKTKMLIAAATVGGLVIAVAVMPEYIRTRYLTFFEIDSKVAQEIDTPESPDGKPSDLDNLHGDTASAQDRKRLLLASIALTFEHPLFGVGPGNFPTAVYEANTAAGIHTEWLVTHNSYTELSSETGFPGLIIFLGMIVASFRSLISVFKRAGEMGDKPDASARALAKYLLLSMAGLCVTIFFLAVGYDFTIYLWAGLAVSLRRTFDAQPVVSEEVVEQPQNVAPQKPVFAPAYAKVQNPLPRHQTPTVSGRPVRFNRFR